MSDRDSKLRWEGDALQRKRLSKLQRDLAAIDAVTGARSALSEAYANQPKPETETPRETHVGSSAIN